MTNIWKPDVVIYHANCMDGMAAAAIAYLRYSDVGVQYVADSDRDRDFIKNPLGPRLDLTGKNILILDYCYNKQSLEQLREIAGSVVIVDHHTTALDAVPKSATRIYADSLTTGSMSLAQVAEYMTPEMRMVIVHSSKFSGAVLTWKLLYPNRVDLPELIRHIGDYDMYNIGENTIEVALALRSMELDFRSLLDLILRASEPGDATLVNIIAQGSSMKLYHDHIVEKIVTRGKYFVSQW